MVKAQRIVIEISGGNLQAVYTDAAVEVVLVDWDNIKQGGTGVRVAHEPLRRVPDDTADILELVA